MSEQILFEQQQHADPLTFSNPPSLLLCDSGSFPLISLSFAGALCLRWCGDKLEVSSETSAAVLLRLVFCDCSTETLTVPWSSPENREFEIADCCCSWISPAAASKRFLCCCSCSLLLVSYLARSSSVNLQGRFNCCRCVWMMCVWISLNASDVRLNESNLRLVRTNPFELFEDLNRGMNVLKGLNEGSLNFWTVFAKNWVN
jgi:hypothetical protein